MGIKGLTKLLESRAPRAAMQRKLENYSGREIAIDASMCIYQFLIVVGRRGTETLTNEAGEVTSHLLGLFNRTVRLLEAGIKPVFVFDGPPPLLKKHELAKRFSRREDADKNLSTAMEKVYDHDLFSADDIMGEAEVDLPPMVASGDMQIRKWFKTRDNALIDGRRREEWEREEVDLPPMVTSGDMQIRKWFKIRDNVLIDGMRREEWEREESDHEERGAGERRERAGDQEAIEKFSKRTVKVTTKQNEDCKRLLKLMGIPIIQAPSEAEAQCAALCTSGKVYAVASEDVDSLTFGTPRFLRHFMDPTSKKIPITEFEISKVLEELQLTMDQFIDLCILCGCDYCSSIRGIGGQTALKLIRQHGLIENVLENMNQERFKVPEDWPYQEVRRLFKEPMVSFDVPDLTWDSPDEEALLEFLVQENNFNPDRVLKGIGKIEAALKKHTPILPSSSIPIFPSQATELKASRCKIVTPAVSTSKIHTRSIMTNADVTRNIWPICKFSCCLAP